MNELKFEDIFESLFEHFDPTCSIQIGDHRFRFTNHEGSMFRKKKLKRRMGKAKNSTYKFFVTNTANAYVAHSSLYRMDTVLSEITTTLYRSYEERPNTYTSLIADDLYLFCRDTKMTAYLDTVSSPETEEEPKV